MAVEIERKFLVTGDGWKAGVSASKAIRQGYLARGEGVSVRIRIVDDASGLLTIKSDVAGATRQEFEYAVPLDEAEALLALAAGNLIRKRRHLVPDPASGLIWEVDLFEGRLDGLLLAEIELDAEERSFALPSWIGREVTDDQRYYNEQLAAAPRPPDASVE